MAQALVKWKCNLGKGFCYQLEINAQHAVNDDADRLMFTCIPARFLDNSQRYCKKFKFDFEENSGIAIWRS